jgi:glutathione S-transferase
MISIAGNFLENAPFFTIALLIAGLQWPIASTVMGAGWLASRIAYAVGYTRADKDNGSGRLIGSGFWLFQLGLFGMVGSMGGRMLA